MYRDYSAADWRKYLKFDDDYVVDGVIVFGGNETYPYRLLYEVLSDMNVECQTRRLEGEYLGAILEVRLDGRRLWFIVSYGGAQLSEFLHLACMFGSRSNILVGNCGGLKSGAKSFDLVVPMASYATESSAVIYQPDADNLFKSDASLSQAIIDRLSANHAVHSGETMTCQAMFAEGYEHVEAWLGQGYVAVEMEASTVFAVSNYFNVPSAAILKIIDNLVENETIVENGYSSAQQSHESVIKQMLAAALDVM